MRSLCEIQSLYGGLLTLCVSHVASRGGQNLVTTIVDEIGWLQLYNNMALQVSFATINDVERIADIHLTAFDSNPLLHVQFPTPTALAALKTILQHDMLRTIQRGEACGRIVLVVRDESIQDKVISFAKWDLPTLTEDVRMSNISKRSHFAQKSCDDKTKA